MKQRRVLWIGAGVILLAVLAWLTSKGLERLVRPRPEPTTTGPAAPPAATAHIMATLFYASPDGLSLVPLQRDVPLAEGSVAQGRQVMASLLEAAPSPYLSVIPKGTKLRAFYLTERGDAFVDLTSEVSTAHPGGSLTELLTVYAIVNAVTVNLPTVQRVQLLIDGKEVDTIAGHVDVRRPLQRDTSFVKEP